MFFPLSIFRSLRIIVLIAVVSTASAQPYLRFDNYGKDAKLSDTYIECITADSRGFIWAGTWNGLNRFDGNSFKSYFAGDATGSKMVTSWIFCIFEDSKKNLWVGTNTQILKYNPSTDNFDSMPNIGRQSVLDIKEDTGGILWISTRNGLYCYDHAHGKVLGHYCMSGGKYDFPSNSLSEIAISSDGTIWVSSIDKGLLHFDPNTGHTDVFSTETTGKNGIASNKLRTISFDRSGRLWIGTYDNGISVLDTALGKFRNYQNNIGNNTTIGSNAVSKIVCDSKGQIWVCCQNGYLNRYNPLADNFLRYINTPYLHSGLRAESISYFYEDIAGNFWIGTHGDGLYSVNKIKNQFKLYCSIPDRPHSLSSNKVSSFVQMDDGKLLVATDGGGLNIFDPANETFVKLGIGQGLRTNAVTDIKRGRGQTVWMATWNGGIAQLDYTTKRITSYMHQQDNAESLIFNNIKGVFPDGDTLWIATHGEGIALMDIRKGVFRSQKDSGMLFNLGSPVWANGICKDSKGRRWLSTNYYLYMFDGKRLQHYEHNDPAKATISSNIVNEVYEDSHGTIWAVCDKGIDRYNESLNKFESWSEHFGFPVSPKAIVEDRRKMLWVSTSDGLIRYDLNTDAFRKFSIDDGLPFADFLYKSAFCLRDGSLMFGGNSGFLHFHPDSLPTDASSPNVVFSELYLDNALQSIGSNNLPRSLETLDSLTFEYSHSIISIAFACLDLYNPQALTYSYQLRGMNDSWIPLGRDKRVTFSNLSPGTYTLIIRTFKQGQLTSTDSRELVIVVLPPWWQEWWFIALSVIVVAGVIWQIVQYRFNSIKRANRLLEQQVADRTKELLAANTELSELNKMKTKLLSIIAHDLKNPMNAISGFSSMLLQRFSTLTDEKKKEYAERIAQSAQAFQNQLEQLLGWALAQSNRLNPEIVEVDVNAIIGETVALVSEMAQRKKIQITATTRSAHRALADAGMIATVIRNLTTNAIKFTGQGGTVEITSSEDDRSVFITVTDNGVGMAETQRAALFSSPFGVSKYGTNNEKGTGLGLNICKEFTEKNRGTLTVTSEPGKGSSFVCQLPIGSRLADEHIPQIPHQQPAPEPDDTAASGETGMQILIVDDNADIRAVLVNCLQQNYQVAEAANGAEGLEIARDLLPDLIISDVAMPVMDGTELCRILKKDTLTRHIPLLLLSGEILPEQQLLGLQRGADDYITKPFSPAMLLAKVNNILATRIATVDHLRKQMILSPELALPQSTDDDFLNSLVKHIENKLTDPELSVEWLAGEMHLSRAQLFRKCKSIVGQAPLEFIRNYRLKKAAALLKTTDWRISEVALEVGFADPQIFSKWFHREYGCTPSQYAKSK